MLKLGIKVGVVLGVLLVPGSFLIAIGAWLYQHQKKRGASMDSAPIIVVRSEGAPIVNKRNYRLGRLPRAWPFHRVGRNAPPPQDIERAKL